MTYKKWFADGGAMDHNEESMRLYKSLYPTQPTTESITAGLGTGLGTSLGTGQNTGFGSAWGDGLSYGQTDLDRDGNLMTGGLFSNSIPTQQEEAYYNRMKDLGAKKDLTFSEQEEYRNFADQGKNNGYEGAQTAIQGANALYTGLVSDPHARAIAKGNLNETKRMNTASIDRMNALAKSDSIKGDYLMGIINNYDKSKGLPSVPRDDIDKVV